MWIKQSEEYGYSRFIDEYNKIYNIITAHIVYLYKLPFFIQVGAMIWVCLNDVIPLLTRFI
jgi:hypothetical protein